MVLCTVFRFGKRGTIGVYLAKGQNITTIFLVGQTDFFGTIIPSPSHVVFSVTIQKTLQWLLGKMEMNMYEFSL